MKSRILLLILFTCTLVGCSADQQKPKNVIDENQYINLLVELQLVRSYSEGLEADSLTIDSLTSEVFKRYAVSEGQFDSSHTYYQQFPAEQEIRVEKAIDRLKMDQVSNTTEDTTANTQ